MSDKTLEQKLSQYHEFFSIEHEFTVNIELIDHSVNSFDSFLAQMPMPFKMASEISTIDQAALRPLQGLSGASQLVDFLNHQSQKIDLLIGYILSQQDEEQHRYQGVKFGGGGIKFASEQAFSVGQFLEMKIFLLDESCAVFCHGEIISVEQDDLQHLHKVIFHFIREDDREALVRTSLHKQSKQLQRLAQQRNQEVEQ